VVEVAGVPRLHPSALVTVAYLKARLDEGSDHLGIFMPLLLDVIARRGDSYFLASEVQQDLVSVYSLVMPQSTIDTLLKRATRKRYLKREFGRYIKSQFPPIPNIEEKTHEIQAAQQKLAQAFVEHASKRGITVDNEGALALLIGFLEDEQIALLLDSPVADKNEPKHTTRERATIAEFFQYIVKDDPVLRAVLRPILEGLVLYHAAFLPNLTEGERRFRNLHVYFDSALVRQAIGYEGKVLQTIVRETMAVLTEAGARCLVFDKTVEEIRRILEYFEGHIGTSHGRLTMRVTNMARHLVTSGYSVSDLREMEAFLEENIRNEGFRIAQTPRRVAEYTADEKSLQKRLSDPKAPDGASPRVMHDVDCLAAILTLRRARTTNLIENCAFIFASSSLPVIRNGTVWYEQDERGIGISPIVHIRALLNLAWLKKPKLCGDLKENELLAVCAAALSPSPDTWQRFLRHLENMEKTNKITSDETALVLVSRMSDKLLKEAELSEAGDADATTLEDVVDRVKSSYTHEFESQLAAERLKTVSERARADAAEHEAADREQRRENVITRRANAIIHPVALGIQWALVALLFVAGIVFILDRKYHLTIVGVITLLSVVAFVILELRGHLRAVAEWRSEFETRLVRAICDWMRAT